MIARIYPGVKPLPGRATRKRVLIDACASDEAADLVRAAIPLTYKVRIPANDVDGYRW